jgi:hypothetical protein
MAFNWGNFARRAVGVAPLPTFIGDVSRLVGGSQPSRSSRNRPSLGAQLARHARTTSSPQDAPIVNDPSLRSAVIQAAFGGTYPGTAGTPGITTPYDSNPFNAAFDARAAALQQQIGQAGAGYQQRLSALSGMFNFGEDPRARAALNQQLAALNRQRDAGMSGINAAYQGGIDGSNRASWLAMANGQQTGRALAGMFNDGASAIQSANNQLAADTARGAGFLGVTGPVGGDSVDVSAALTAAAPREQALAESLGKVDSDMQAWLGQSMVQQRGAEQGLLGREVAARQAAAQQQFAQQEAARIASERAAYQQAQLQLQAEQADRNAQLQAALAGISGDRAQAEAERQLNRERYLADMRSNSAEQQFALQQAALERRRKLNDQYRTDRNAIVLATPAGAQRRSALRQLNRSQPRNVRVVPVSKSKRR